MDSYYDRWTELAEQAWGEPDVSEYQRVEVDANLALDYGIAAFESWLRSERFVNDGAGQYTEYDQGDLEQAEWFFGVAWDALAEREGIESDAWNEQGRNLR